MSDVKAKGTKFDFGWGSAPDPAGGLAVAALPQTPSWPHPAVGLPGLETTCLPKYVSLNPPMSVATEFVIMLFFHLNSVHHQWTSNNIDLVSVDICSIFLWEKHVFKSQISPVLDI